MKLQGATCSNNKLSLSNAISTVLPLTQLRWVKQTNAEKKANVVSGTSWLLWTGDTTPYNQSEVISPVHPGSGTCTRSAVQKEPRFPQEGPRLCSRLRPPFVSTDPAFPRR